MKLSDCYRLLGLKQGAGYDEIKAAYRRLARRYHPDVNPDSLRAKDTFILLTEAYHRLIDAIQPSLLKARRQAQAQAAQAKPQEKPPPKPVPAPAKTGLRKRPTVRHDPNTSATDQQMKERVYDLLQRSLQEQRYPRAIALVEGLAQRLPQDSEVRQWMAIAYQRWGRHLVDRRQCDKARLYLNKALRTDPHNRALWHEVDRDMRRIRDGGTN